MTVSVNNLQNTRGQDIAPTISCPLSPLPVKLSRPPKPLEENFGNFDMRGDVDQPPLARPNPRSLEATPNPRSVAEATPNPRSIEATQIYQVKRALSRPPQTLEALSRPPQTLEALSRTPQTVEASRPL